MLLGLSSVMFSELNKSAICSGKIKVWPQKPVGSGQRQILELQLDVDKINWACSILQGGSSSPVSPRVS